MKNHLINIIGGNAYSTTGGIQAVNRFVIRELSLASRLHKAFLLWDDVTTATTDGQEARKRGIVEFFGLSRFRFFTAVFLQALRYPNDLWLCTHVNYALLGLLLSGWQRKRVALFIYAAEMDENFTALKLFALRRVRFVIAISEYSKKKAVKLGVDPACIHVMHIGTDDPSPGRQAQSVAVASPRILFVGRMDERYKGQTELLDAALLLQNRFPDLRLIFIGGGKTLDIWKSKTQELGLEQMVEFAGRVSDERLKEEYQRAGIFVMLSENEGFGLVYTEAMAQGVPCIGGDRDAACEVISDGETGICVPAGNSTALADVISVILKDPELRRRMGEAGRRRFEENFTEVQYRKRLLAIMVDWQSVL